MASAAAVATDISRSPLPDHEEDEEIGTTGTITTADAVTRADSDDDEEEEEEDVRPNTARRRTNRQALFDDDEEDGDDSTKNEGKPVNNIVDDEDDEASKMDDQDEDLFGDDDDDDDEDEEKPRRHRELDDEDLDSGDDMDRDDRRVDEDAMEHDQVHELEQQAVADADCVRHAVPEPTDGEMYLLKVPPFLTVEPTPFSNEGFKPPTTDHHSKVEPSNTFSAYNTALTTLRWRRSPKDTSQFQSNARIVRWSDGSLTLQLASNPATQYAITANALAPPQHNPKKPTPVSNETTRRKGNKSSAYNAEQDSFTYLTAGHIRSFVLRTTNKFTAGLKVQSATEASSEALERLQNSLLAAGNANGKVEGSGMGVIKITEDPELAKKKAEVAEKEKIKAQRRREAQEARDRDRQGRTLGGRRGVGFGAGLTVGGLEDEDELGAGVGRTPGSASKKRKQPARNRHGEIYSDDEDGYGRRGKTREDEYDEDDGFLARSDEEEEVSASSSDLDDGIRESPRPSSRRQEKPAPRQQQQQQQRLTPEGEADAEGDLDDDAAPAPGGQGSPSGRTKRRRVIEDDEDED